jgi:hypothetical protein
MQPARSGTYDSDEIYFRPRVAFCDNEDEDQKERAVVMLVVSANIEFNSLA